jgi:hypothetical protein
MERKVGFAWTIANFLSYEFEKIITFVSVSAHRVISVG